MQRSAHASLGLALLVGAVLVAACSSSGAAKPSGSAGGSGASTSSASAGAGSSGDTTAVSQVPQTTVPLSTTTTVAQLATRAGATTLHFRTGPFDIQPGQNNIATTTSIPQPTQDGWIVGMRPNLEFADGTIPAVDVIHLHHGVWLAVGEKDATTPSLPQRFFAAGEEKTALALPAPYGYRYSTKDHWVLNYMLHNLTPTARQVWVTYDLDFIPAGAPGTEAMVPARPIWMDVQNGSIYPVFDVLKGSGANGTYTYPNQATNPYAGGAPKNQWTADADGVLIATAGHLHPGGLHTDLYVARSGTFAHLFSSTAKYYEPAGAVSWDVAMTATLPSWRVGVKKGDVLSMSATYDSARASWYESMGIMIVWMGDSGPSSNPFTQKVDRPGMLTHGHLAENDHHGGNTDPKYKDLTALPSAAAPSTLSIKDFLYAQGDMTNATAVPAVHAGQTITFKNLDAKVGPGEWHTITACAAPCNKATGIAYPLADGPVVFDSGQLGFGGAPTADRDTWTIPANLPAGTYTYFCRIHPLMRGAFRVEP
jgi:plastocyanin